MKKNIKIVIGVLTNVIVFSLMTVAVLPYIIVFISLNQLEFQKCVGYHKTAVKYSVFKYQRLHIIPWVLDGIYLSGDYDTVIEYFKLLKKDNSIETCDKMNAEVCTNLVTAAYLAKKDYTNALKYAKNDTQKCNAYIGLNDSKNAKIILDKILQKDPNKPYNYLLKAKIELLNNNFKSAVEDISYMLKRSPKSIEAWQTKADIMQKSGRYSEYQKCIDKIKTLEKKNVRKHG